MLGVAELRALSGNFCQGEQAHHYPAADAWQTQKRDRAANQLRPAHFGGAISA
jgi:hypothetical protein